MNIVNVKVCGMEYNLKGDEREEYLHMLAGFVDKKVRMITENNPKLSISAATVLAAINIADEFFKWNNYIEELENKSAILEGSQKSMKETIDSLKREIEELKKENTNLLENQQKINESEEFLKLQDEIAAMQEEIIGYKEKNNLLEAKGNEADTSDEELLKLQQQFSALEEDAKRYKDKSNILEENNKEIKFSLQSAKYRIMELENKFLDSQLQLAVIKRKNSGNILLK